MLPRLITVCTFIVVGISLGVNASCDDDLLDFTNNHKVLTLTEGTKSGKLFKITDEGDVIIEPDNRFLRIDNGSLVLMSDLVLDGPENKKLCDALNGVIPEFKLKCKGSRSSGVAFYLSATLTDNFDAKFDQPSYEAHIPEHNQIGQELMTFSNQMTDEDCGSGNFIYSLKDTGNSKFGMVSKKSSSKDQSTKYLLQAKDVLDYERQKTYLLGIIAFAQGSNSKSSTTTLTVFVDDVDDEDPYFASTHYSINVMEGENLTNSWLTSAPPILAVDGDTGINTTIEYSVDNPGLQLEVNSSTGEIQIKSILDRETTPDYEVIIKAMQKNNPLRSATTTLTINVKDVNDNLPEFIRKPKTITVKKGTPEGTLIIALPAKDDDERVNAKFTYKLEDESGAFEIKFDSGSGVQWLYVKSSSTLEEKEMIELKVLLEPEIPKLVNNKTCDYIQTCVLNLTVNINGINNHPPVFNHASYSFNFKSGDNITGQVSAKDEDSGDYGNVTYSIEERDNSLYCKNVQIDAISGNFTTSTQFSQGDNCFFMVKACDNPPDKNNQKCTSVPVSLSLQEVNIHHPVFNHTSYLFKFHLGDNITGKVSAKDEDSGDYGNVTYSIVKEGISSQCADVQIDALSGIFTESKQLSQDHSCFFKVKACDNPPDKNDQKCTSVPVLVMTPHANNHHPVFDNSSYLFKFQDGDKITGMVSAKDEDFGDYGNVTYSIVKGGISSQCENVQIGALSGIFTEPKQFSQDQSCFFMVKACDNPPDKDDQRCTSVTVSVMGLNVTNNYLIFDNATYLFKFQSDDKITGKVSAKVENSNNLTVTYSIEDRRNSTNCQDVQIDPHSGNFTKSKQLSPGDSCFFMVKACDNSLHKKDQCTSAPVWVMTLNMNNHPPIFKEDSYLFNFQPSEKITGKVSTEDNDSGDYRKVTYSIEKGQTSPYCQNVQIDTLSGNFTMSTQSFQGHSCFFMVKACYKSRLCTSVPVVVIKQKVANHPPVFNQSNYSFKFRFEAPITGKVLATDVDTGDYGNATYSIEKVGTASECEHLEIDPLSGTFKEAEQFSKDISCFFIVKACDNPPDKADQRCATTLVSIQTTRIKLSYNVTVDENIRVETTLLTFPENDLVVNDDNFSMKSGSLRTMKLLDRESKSSYEVHLYSSSQPETSLSVVYIQVLDVNDNAPVFNQSVYIVDLMSDKKPGDKLLQITATDADEGINAKLTFSILDGREWFSIDNKTGEITMEKQPPLSDKEKISVRLTVTDHGSPSLTSLALLEVYNPLFNETTSLILPLSVTEVKKAKTDIERFLSDTLKYDVKINEIEALPSGVWSKLLISAKRKDGRPIPKTILDSMLKTYADEIQAKYGQHKTGNSDSSKDNKFKIPFIVVLSIAAVLLIILLFAIFMMSRKLKRHQKKIRIFKKLNADTTIYDREIQNDSTSEENEEIPKSDIIALESANQNGFVNHVYAPDYDNASEEREPTLTQNDLHYEPMNRSQDDDANPNTEVSPDNVNEIDSSITAVADVHENVADNPDYDNSDNPQPETVQDSFIPNIYPDLTQEDVESEIPTNTEIPQDSPDNNKVKQDLVNNSDIDSGLPSDKDVTDEDEDSSSLDDKSLPSVDFVGLAERVRVDSDKPVKKEITVGLTSIDDGEPSSPLGSKLSEDLEVPDPDYGKKVRFGDVNVNVESQADDKLPDEKTKDDTEPSQDAEAEDGNYKYFQDTKITAL